MIFSIGDIVVFILLFIFIMAGYRTLNKGVVKNNKTISDFLDNLSNKVGNHEDRLKRIEKHLKLPRLA